jgi:hypothetical protein
MGQEVIGTIQHIVYYPVKSCGGIEVQHTYLTKTGLDGDREYMIVRAGPDEDGIYSSITQRDKRNYASDPQSLSILALIKPQVIYGKLFLTWNGKNSIEVPEDMQSGKKFVAQLFDDTVSVIDQGNTLAEWLYDHLGIPVRLVKMDSSFHRLADQDYIHNDNPIHFQDGYPLHWFFGESVDALSKVAGDTIPWQTFRPNIVVAGSPAETEHTVSAGEIAGIPFLQARPCPRCAITNVDQMSGEVKIGRVLTPLAQYKKRINKKGNTKVIFGEYALPCAEGEIRVGDQMVLPCEITVLQN